MSAPSSCPASGEAGLLIPAAGAGAAWLEEDAVLVTEGAAGLRIPVFGASLLLPAVREGAAFVAVAVFVALAVMLPMGTLLAVEGADGGEEDLEEDSMGDRAA